MGVMSGKRRSRLKFEDPPQNWASTLAKTLERGNPLDRSVALVLVGRPHRYAELRPLLHGKGDNNLTQALRRLRGEGVIQMRTNFRVDAPYDYYELTDLGIDVVLTLAERRALDKLAMLARDARVRDEATA